jgi:hypothetical protein
LRRELAAIPRLRDPERQKKARKKKPGRSGRDDRREDVHKSAASGGRYKGEEKGKFRNRSEDRPLQRQAANAREEHEVRVRRRRRQTDGNSLIPERGELQDSTEAGMKASATLKRKERASGSAIKGWGKLADRAQIYRN